MTSDIPARLLARLDDLGRVLADRGDALALIGLGSVGADLARLDDHSDLDFFVVVEDGAKPRYLADIDWLEAVGPIAFDFANTVDGRKVLFDDGLYAEYAVFTLAELADAAYAVGSRRVAARGRPGRAGGAEEATSGAIARDDRVACRRGADQPLRRRPS